MIKRFFAVIALSLLTGSVCAAVITANSSYTDSTGGNDFALGQSVTTPSGGPWDNISFNFINSAGSPYANGTLYLLALEYLGTTVGLSSSTPGFVATSSSSAGGIWAFASSVALQAATTYWFYMDTLFDGTEQVRYSAVNPYAGGSSYQADGAAGTFSAHVNKTEYFYDLAFSLQGTEQSRSVPEPATLALLGLGLAGLGFSRRKKA